MPCAKARRIESATRWSVFWGVRPSGSASFYKCRALKLKNFRIPPSHPPAIVSHSKIPVTRATGGTHLGGIFRSHPHPPTLVFYHTQKQWSCNQLGDPIWGSFYKNIKIKKSNSKKQTAVRWSTKNWDCGALKRSLKCRALKHAKNKSEAHFL